MFVSLLLLAIFSFVLPFYAEAQGQLPPAPKCDQSLVAKIYDYWNKNGGIPQRLIEKNIKCSQREVAVLATQNFGGADLKCIVFRHFADSKIVYFVNNNNVTDILHEIVEEHSGQIYEPYDNPYYVRGILSRICIGLHLVNVTGRMGTRFEIAQCGGAKLSHVCSRHPEAKAGSSMFIIRGVEGKVTKAGCDAMKELIASFGSTEILRTFNEKCPVPNEEPLIGSFCDGNSCAAHNQ